MPRKSQKNKKYSAELKMQAVQDYLSGKGSYETIRKKYEILNSKQVKNWVKWYNGHKDFKERSSAKKLPIFTMSIYSSTFSDVFDGCILSHHNKKSLP